VWRSRRRALHWTWRPVVLLLSGLACAAVIVVGVLVSLPWVGLAVAVLPLLVWLTAALRLRRRLPSGGGPGRIPPGGASMREPRRPLPRSPAGAAARPFPDEEPDSFVALA
jgi:hypothetical protein